MDDIQHGRHLLDFIDDDIAGIRSSRDQLAQALGSGQKKPLRLRLKKVDPNGVVAPFAQPGGFAGTTRAEKEEAGGWAV